MAKKSANSKAAARKVKTRVARETKQTAKHKTRGKVMTAKIVEQWIKHEKAGGMYNPVDLSMFSGIDDAAAIALSKHDYKQDDLYLNGLQALSRASAVALARASAGCLELDGLSHLHDGVAESLSDRKGSLRLDGLKMLSDRDAALLARQKGELTLRGLQTISDGAAEALAAHTKGRLVLSGLTSVSDAAARALAKHRGDLVLEGLEELSDAAAQAFKKFPYHLNLYGLKSLSEAVAKSLEDIERDGRLEFRCELCKTIERLKANYYGWNGVLQYRGWKLAETDIKQNALPKKIRQTLKDAFRGGHEPREITRLTLTPPRKGGARHEYFVVRFGRSDRDYSNYLVSGDSVIAKEAYQEGDSD